MKFSGRKLLLTLFVIGVVGLLVYAFLPKPIEVEVATAERGDLQVTVDEDGKTRIKEKYIISTPLSGRLLRVDLDPGDHITQNKTLAIIEPTVPELLDVSDVAQIKARVNGALASKKQAIAQEVSTRRKLELARDDYERAQKLYKTRGSSDQRYSEAKHKLLMADANHDAATMAVQVAQFQLELAQAALLRTEPGNPSASEEMQVRVSFDVPEQVQVLRVFQESETIVTPGKKLLEVGNTTNLEVEVDVLSQDGVRIQQQLKEHGKVPVYLEGWGGEHPLPGRVRLVEPGAFLKISALGVEEQRVNVIIDFDFPSEAERMKGLALLGDAYRVVARIVIWEGKDVVKVPAGALFRHEGEWAVFRVQDGVAKLQPVRVGHGNGLETEIISGLEPGAGVILHPNDQIRDGVQVFAR